MSDPKYPGFKHKSGCEYDGDLEEHTDPQQPGNKKIRCPKCGTEEKQQDFWRK